MPRIPRFSASSPLLCLSSRNFCVRQIKTCITQEIVIIRCGAISVRWVLRRAVPGGCSKSFSRPPQLAAFPWPHYFPDDLSMVSSCIASAFTKEINNGWRRDKLMFLGLCRHSIAPSSKSRVALWTPKVFILQMFFMAVLPCVGLYLTSLFDCVYWKWGAKDEPSYAQGFGWQIMHLIICVVVTSMHNLHVLEDRKTKWSCSCGMAPTIWHCLQGGSTILAKWPPLLQLTSHQMFQHFFVPKTYGMFQLHPLTLVSSVPSPSSSNDLSKLEKLRPSMMNQCWHWQDHIVENLLPYSTFSWHVG